jgi:hypothetical protein
VLKREEARGEVVGVRERDEMAPTNRVHLRIESGAGDFSLEGKWEEAIVGSSEDADWNVRPRAKTTRLLKCRANFFARVRRVLKDGFGHVVQKVCCDIELDGVAAAFGCVRARSCSARVLPPLPGGFAGSRNHRIDEDQFPHGHAFAHERRGKPRERLRDENNVRSGTDCVDNSIGVRVEPRAFVVAR